MTELITRKHGHSCFEIIVKTTDEKHYEFLQEAARLCVDGKPLPKLPSRKDAE